jgi:serine protease Do
MRVLPVAVSLLVAVGAGAAQPVRDDVLDAFERRLKAVHEKAGPAMACVVVSRSDQYPKPAAPPDYPGRLGVFDAEAFRKGSPDRAALARRLDLGDIRGIPDHESAAGVVLDPAGLVLTNFHTVEGATKVYIHLPGGKGSYADIHSADARADLAVLKLITPPPDLKAVKFGDARLFPLPAGPQNVFTGKIVAALAFQPPGGFAPDGPGVTLPIVGAIRLPSWNPNKDSTPQSVYRYAPLLELDARAVPAVSGAALLNLDGELIGLTSTMAVVSGGDGGRTYAVPVDANMRRVIETLARGEEVEYGFLGITLNQELINRVEVSTVAPRTPAEGRLSRGDTILTINGQPTTNYPALLYQIGSTLAGNRATLTVRGPGSDAAVRMVEITVAKFKHENTVIAASRPAPVFGLRVDWGSVLSQPAGALVVPPGVAVRELVPDSPAAARFKELGDSARWLITAVNGTPTPTPAAFYAATRNQAAVRLTVLDPADRQGRPRDVTLP